MKYLKNYSELKEYSKAFLADHEGLTDLLFSLFYYLKDNKFSSFNSLEFEKTLSDFNYSSEYHYTVFNTFKPNLKDLLKLSRLLFRYKKKIEYREYILSEE